MPEAHWLFALAVVPFLMGAAAAPVDEQRVAFTFQDPEITESSGLVVQGDLAFTVNDSGDSGRVFAVDTRTGETVGTTSWSPDPTDVEAIAPAGPGEVWVADIGDNRAARDSVQVLRVPVGRGERTVEPTTYELTYPDGAQDAETLLCDPATGRLYVGSKGLLGGTLYAAPAELSADGPNVLERVGDILPIATDGAFFPDGQHVIIRNYSVAAVYAFPSLERVGDVTLPSQEQGEGIAVTGRDRVLVSSEGQQQDVLRVPLPDGLLPTASATPSTEPPRTASREDSELPETVEATRPAWPWFLTGLLGVGALVVLMRSLRRR